MLPMNERFKETRKKLGFNQKEFASEIGISQTHVSSIENGKDNPSAALLKLICVKFNISEQWLFEGLGSPQPGWNIDTDEGAIAKYNAMRVSFEHSLRRLAGNDLACNVETFAFLTSLLTMNVKGLSIEDSSKYYEYVRLVIDDFEKLAFKTTVKDIVPPKNDAKHRILYKNECYEYVNKITENIKNAVNLFLVNYGEEMQL